MEADDGLAAGDGFEEGEVTVILAVLIPGSP